MVGWGRGTRWDRLPRGRGSDRRPLTTTHSEDGSGLYEAGRRVFALLNGEAIREGAAGAPDEPAAQTRRRNADFHEAVSRVGVAAHPAGEVTCFGIVCVNTVDPLAADTERHDDGPGALTVRSIRPGIHHAIAVIRSGVDTRTAGPQRELLTAVEGVIVCLENEIHLLVNKQVHDVRANRARLADKRNAVFVNANDHPLNAARPCLIYRVGRPVVVRAACGVRVGTLTRKREIGRDVDESGERPASRIVEVVLLAVTAGDSADLVRKTGCEFSDLAVRAVILMVSGDQFDRERTAHALLDEVTPGGFGSDLVVAEVAYR